jgi:hypothetical protein
MRHSSIVVLGILNLFQGCGGSPPDYTSDEDDARLYADILALSRLELNITVPTYLHPYLAVARDEEGAPKADLSTFEYEPSAALELLRQRDSTVVLCRVHAQGMCAEDYVVISQTVRLGERDAIVVVRSVRGPGSVRALVVKLRYGNGTWNVSGSELIT